MKKINKSAFWGLGLSLLAFKTVADITVSPNSTIYWPGTSNQAAKCSLRFSTIQPLSQPRTLTVDNSLPNGSVLYSWGFEDFVPEIYSTCDWASSTSVNSLSQSYSYLQTVVSVRGFSLSLLPGTGLLPTSNPGIGLKVYYKFNYKGDQPTGISGSVSTILLPAEYGYVVGAENAIRMVSQPFMTQYNPITNDLARPFTLYYSRTYHQSSLSLRGELIKIGPVTESQGLQVNNIGSVFTYIFGNRGTDVGSGTVNGSDVLGGGGINIATSSCRLSGSTDYQINLGRWESRDPGSLPAHSAVQPLDINLECSGQVNNVMFSFQDTGSTPLPNQNIGVYDSVGGQFINGLEIEMFYNGSRINVHKMSEAPNSYQINTGSHGSVNTGPSTSFNSQSQVQFGARFIQNSAITRGGNAYTGPVAGLVNMFITYN